MAHEVLETFVANMKGYVELKAKILKFCPRKNVQNTS